MSGVQGLGGVGGPPDVTSRLEKLGMQVNPRNVVKVRAVLLAEADRLEKVFVLREQRARVRLCGDDPVSHDAMLAFNCRIEGFLAAFRAQYTALRDAGERLAVTAREYGIAESRIEASARGLRAGLENRL